MRAVRVDGSVYSPRAPRGPDDEVPALVQQLSCGMLRTHNLAQVSLSGKNKSRTQETKQDFLERTRREREAREVQRRREKAALDVQVGLALERFHPAHRLRRPDAAPRLRVRAFASAAPQACRRQAHVQRCGALKLPFARAAQAFLRGRRAAQEHRASQRQGWDAELQSIAAAWATCPTSGPPPAELRARLAALLRRLLFFYRANADGDDARLTAFALWVLRGNGIGRKGQLLLCDSFASDVHASASATKAGEEGLMVRRVRALMSLSLSRLQRLAQQAAGDVHALDCGLLLTLTDKNVFGSNVLLHRTFLDALMCGGLMRVVCAHLKRAFASRGPVASAEPYPPAEENLQLLLITLASNVLALTDGEGPKSQEYSAVSSAPLSPHTSSAAALSAGAASPAAGSAARPADEAVEQFCRHILTIKDVLRPGALSPKGVCLSVMQHGGVLCGVSKCVSVRVFVCVCVCVRAHAHTHAHTHVRALGSDVNGVCQKGGTCFWGLQVQEEGPAHLLAAGGYGCVLFVFVLV